MKKKVLICIAALLLMLNWNVCAEDDSESEGLKIYESPSLSSKQIYELNTGESAAVLEMGDYITIDGIQSFWVKVRLPNGDEGWGLAAWSAAEDDESDTQMNEDNRLAIIRKGSKVTVTNNNKEMTSKNLQNTKDPTIALAVFFNSYLSKNKEWKNLVADSDYFDSKDDLIANLNKAYKDFYGKVDSLQIIIDPMYFAYNSDGSATYLLVIQYTLKNTLYDDIEEVVMYRDEEGNWSIVEFLENLKA